MTSRRGLLAAALLLAAAGVPEPDGFRMDDYQAPTPSTLRGARVVDTGAMRELVAAGGAVLIDVLPAPRRPEAMRPGTPWLPVPHRAIPGSRWLPTVGLGVITVAAERQLADVLAEATGGRRDTPIAFYCKPECWVSWNAARRAVALGWSNVIWYPEGIEGWTAAGLPTEIVEPAPLQE